MKSKTILVICRGYSSEREVSLKTGQNVYQSLLRQGYNSKLLILSNQKKNILSEILDATKETNIDLVFNALHGEFGEDGKLAAILDTIGVPYTGSGQLAGSLGMDKAKLSSMLSSLAVRIPQTITLQNNFTDDQIKNIKSTLRLPVVVKPNNAGSSIGVTILNDWAEFRNTVTSTFSFSDVVLVQEYINGVEITSPVIGDIALPVGEIKVDNSSNFFDYKAKYSPELTKEIFPALLPDAVLQKTQELAVTIHDFIGARGLTRCDFIYNQDSGEIVFLEINTTPGMTDTSLVLKSAQSYGWDFDRLVSEIVNCTTN